MNKEIDWNIGCSGFYYKEWKGNFYPAGVPAAKWFSLYCHHFNSLESNVTFYRMPDVKTLLKWYDESPPDFSFSVKVPRLITHFKKFENIDKDLMSFYGLVSQGLKNKLACVLFQFPPSFSFNEERLKAIIGSLSNNFINVVEFRDSGWWQQDIFDQLQQHNIVFCNISHPKYEDAFVPTSPVSYFRFHGAPDLYKSDYSEHYLDTIITSIKANKKSNSAFLYFNNTMSGAAIKNANYVKMISV
jgi:uncharacterized protein YecE (DUF72 family)